MKSTPLLTVVVPMYNEAPRLTRAIEPFLVSNLSVIAVNDGSTDNTLNVLKELENKYNNLRIINLVKNSGKALAMKTGIMYVKTPYVLFSDADFDDINVSAILKTFHKVLQNHENFMILYNTSLSLIDSFVNKPITGMRILRTDTVQKIFANIEDRVKYGYLIETYINMMILKRKLPVFYHDLKYKQILKARKWGFLKGVVMDTKMFFKIMFHPWNVYNLYIKFFSKRVLQ